MLNFEDRKRDHIAISLSPQSQASESAGLERVALIHEAIPEINFSDISLKTKTLGMEVSSPIFVSSMTLGHKSAYKINEVIASVCQFRNILMGVGSQRRQLEDPKAIGECITLRKRFPKLKVMGNLGLSQLIQISVDDVKELVDSLEAQAMIIHTNPLQECIQPEGTPQFKGGLQALENLCEELSVPVILKETGCGFSRRTLEKLKDIGLAAIDVSGKGGTHWGRVEAQRLAPDDVRVSAGASFADWGIATVDSLVAAREIEWPKELWASGGVKNGLDVAKLVALGADQVGLAKPILEAALKGESALQSLFESLEYELKTALFCTGTASISEFQRAGVWKWI
jgi:isopentenyl-diphosphate Delta-isomerase